MGLCPMLWSTDAFPSSAQEGAGERPDLPCTLKGPDRVPKQRARLAMPLAGSHRFAALGRASRAGGAPARGDGVRVRGAAGAVVAARQAKVGQLQCAIGRQQDVPRFQVPVHEACRARADITGLGGQDCECAQEGTHAPVHCSSTGAARAESPRASCSRGERCGRQAVPQTSCA